MELLELIERIMNNDGSQSQLNFWLECLALNIGCSSGDLTDLIFYPVENVDSTGEQILAAALQIGKRDS